jgi:hypothetical protein
MRLSDWRGARGGCRTTCSISGALSFSQFALEESINLCLGRMELSRIAQEMYMELDSWLSKATELPTLVIGDVFTFAGPMIAESRRIPLIVNSPVLLGGITNPLKFISIQDMNVGSGSISLLIFSF